jgi:hypothetical protein
MATKVIENLVTKLSFKFDDDQLKSFNDGIKVAAKGMVAVVAGATAAAAGIFAFTKAIAEANDKTGKLSERIGVDLGAMQELGFVAELNGGSIDSMNGSLENLSKITSEAARGVGAGVEVFGMLGLSATDATGKVKSADNLLLEISDSVAGLGTQAEKLELTQKLGISPNLLLSIQNGSKALLQQREEARQLGFIIDKDATGAAANFNDEMLKMSKVVKGVASAIGTKLMKVITPVIKLFIAWFKVNKKFIQQGFQKFFKVLIDVISGVFNIIMRVYNVVNTAVQAFGGWLNIIKLAAAALIALNATALFIPLILTAVGIAIMLLIEDLQKFANGGDSWIGNLLEDFPLLAESLKILLGWIGKIAEGWKLLFSDELGNAIEGLGMMIDDIISWFIKLGGTIKNIGIDLLSKFISPLNKGIALLNKIPGVNIGAASLGGTASETTNPVPTASAGQTSNVINNNQTKNESKPNINIKIDGGNTADVRKTITDVLNEQYAGAHENLKSAVEY